MRRRKSNIVAADTRWVCRHACCWEALDGVHAGTESNRRGGRNWEFGGQVVL